MIYRRLLTLLTLTGLTALAIADENGVSSAAVQPISQTRTAETLVIAQGQEYWQLMPGKNSISIPITQVCPANYNPTPLAKLSIAGFGFDRNFNPGDHYVMKLCYVKSVSISQVSVVAINPSNITLSMNAEAYMAHHKFEDSWDIGIWEFKQICSQSPVPMVVNYTISCTPLQ